MKTAATETINRRYRDMPDSIALKMAQRGYGSSGVMGNELWKSEFERMGALNGLEGTFAGLQLDQENRLVDNAMRYAFANPGTSSNYSETIPGNMFGGGVSSGLESFTTLLMLDAMMQGQGPGGGK